MLTGSAPPLNGNPAAHLGLVVVQRLALTHHLRVHLTSRQAGGTTATVLIPDALLCEIASPARAGADPASPTNISRAARPARRLTDGGSSYQGSAQVPTSHLMLVNGQPGGDDNRSGRREPGSSGNGLPRRVRESLRGDSMPTDSATRPLQPAALPEPRTSPEPHTSPETAPDRRAWPDETADFAAGINDAQWSVTNDRSEGNL
jgi:hypothetical protein